MNTKYRVRNTKTGNFVSEELSSTAATKLCGELTIISDQYEVVEVEDERLKQLEESSSVARDMDDDEIDGIRNLHKISAIYNDYKIFSDDMYTKVQTGQRVITEKQAAYLWHLIYRYRRQIPETRIINIAEERKVY